MPDLEDQFFKSYVPGQYSAWDVDGAGADADGADRRREGLAHHDAVPENSSATGPPMALNSLEATTSRNTGAKGVLADHRASKEEEAYRRRLEKMEKEAILDRAVRGARLRAGEVSLSESAMEERRRAEKVRERNAECCDSDGSESNGGYLNADTDDDDDDDDDDFMRSYRQKRLLEMKNEATTTKRHSNISGSSPQYGEVEDVTPIQYAEAVDETDANVTLVVHLYEPFIPACNDINNHLVTLARAMPSVRFVRLLATEAKPDFDPVALPSVLLYRGGEMVNNLTPVTEHLPDRFTAEDMKNLLEMCGAMGYNSRWNAPSNSAITRSTNLQNRLGGAEFYDSDDAELDHYCADFAG